MNTIVILCGGNSCGKTTTLKGFFGISKNAQSPEYHVERKINGKTVCAVSFGSPQEQSKFCNVKQVQENIDNRTQTCDKESKVKPYILLIPFTMSGSRKERKKLNEDCIIKPIEKLKEKFKVFVVYLRKTNARNLAEKDALMKKIAIAEFETTKNDYDKSRELEKFLKEKIIV
jgi:ADP-heptose:LPS heptosyltransferase